MHICGDCIFYDEINAEKGKCKCKKAERHVVIKEGSVKEVVNGWPVVMPGEKACGDFSDGQQT